MLNFLRFSVNDAKNKGFTLAEVLIVLGIIGVIAALTIPTLVQKQNEAAAIAGVKKAYSTLSNAYIKAINENGEPPDNWHVNSNGQLALIDALTPYLKISKNCGTAPGCFPDTDYKYLDSNASYGNIDSSDFYQKATLADGSLIAAFSNYAAICPNYTTQSICSEVLVDINGFKGPNVSGRDLFTFLVLKNKIIPFQATQYFDPGLNMTTCCKLHCETAANWILINGNMDYVNISDGCVWGG